MIGKKQMKINDNCQLNNIDMIKIIMIFKISLKNITISSVQKFDKPRHPLVIRVTKLPEGMALS